MGLGILSLIGRKPALPFINKHKGLISLLLALFFKPLKIIRVVILSVLAKLFPKPKEISISLLHY